MTFNDFNSWFARVTFSNEARISLYESLADYMVDGTPVIKAITTVREQYQREGKSKSDTIFLILNDLIDKLERGVKFSEAIQAWVPTIEFTLIEIHEKAEGIEPGLRAALNFLLKAGNLRSIWVGAVLYPIALVIALCGLLYLYGTKVLPAFAALLSPDEWPTAGRQLYIVTTVFADTWWMFLIGFVLMIALAIYSLPFYAGKLRPYLDKIPPWSFYKMDIAVSFSGSMIAQFRAGIPIVNALDNIGKNADPYMRRQVEAIKEPMVRGVSFGNALIDTGGTFPDAKLVSLFCMHEGKDTFNTSLPDQYQRWMEGREKALRKKAKLISFLGMVLVFVVVGFVYFTVSRISTNIGEALSSVHR